MAVTIGDVRHIASLAHLAIDDARAHALVGELNTILAHMDVLAQIDTTGVEVAVAPGTTRAPLRSDAGPPASLAHPLAAFAPQVREGFILVPRLSTHEDARA